MRGNKLTIGLVQEKWHNEPQVHQDKLAAGILAAAMQGAKIVCLQELTLSPYFCTRPNVDPAPFQEDIQNGPTATFISRMAQKAQVTIIASLFEKAGYNTAVAFNEYGQLIAVTRKQHIPFGEKYHENCYFKPGNSQYPVYTIQNHKFGIPTCYDQWFPEVSRIYSIKGAEILVYPTAIGDEPTMPGFDTQPQWQKVIVAQGIMSNTFMVVVNRIGIEDGLQFYGSSFISNPLGEILVQAERNKPAVLTAELDFDVCKFWGKLFPFLQQREPASYENLLK